MTLYQSGSTMQTTKFQNEALIYHTKLNFLKYFYILLLQLFLYTWNVLEELKNLPGFFLRVCSHENSFPVIFPFSRLTGVLPRVHIQNISPPGWDWLCSAVRRENFSGNKYSKRVDKRKETHCCCIWTYKGLILSLYSQSWCSHTFGGSTSITDSKTTKIIYYVFVTNIKAKEVFK